MTTAPTSATTVPPGITYKTPPSKANLPTVLSPMPYAMMFTSTESQSPSIRTTTTSPSTTSSPTPTTTTTTTSPWTTPATPQHSMLSLIGYRFNATDKFNSLYIGSPQNTKIFLPQIKFNKFGRLVSLEVSAHLHKLHI